MKGKFQSEEKNPQAMPLSKVVKRPLGTNMEIKAFALKEMIVEAEVVALAEEERLLAQKKMWQEAYEQGVAAGYEDGSQKGFSEGFAKGFDEGEHSGSTIKEGELAEYDKTVQLLLPLISNLKDWTEKIEAAAERDVLAISIAVASRIVQKEISDHPEVLLSFVTEGLKRLGPAETAFIRIHPGDFELLSRKNQALLQAVEGVQSLKFEPDPTLLPGNVIVESATRSIDARMSSKLAIIERRLLLTSEQGKDK